LATPQRRVCSLSANPIYGNQAAAVTADGCVVPLTPWIDSEVVIELEGSLSFDALQAGLHPAESRIHKLAAETSARLILFDILVTPNGTNLIGASLTERRAESESLVASVRP